MVLASFYHIDSKVIISMGLGFLRGFLFGSWIHPPRHSDAIRSGSKTRLQIRRVIVADQLSELFQEDVRKRRVFAHERHS